MNPKSKRHQIFSYYEILCLDSIIQIKSIKKLLAILFNTTKSNVISHMKSYEYYCKHSNDPNFRRGKPLTFNQDQVNTIFNEIKQKEKEYQPMNKSDILFFINKFFGKNMSKKWASRFVKKYESLSYSEAIPLDEKRIEVSSDEISQFFDELTEAINDSHPDLIFNVDEIGFTRKNNFKKKMYYFYRK